MCVEHIWSKLASLSPSLQKMPQEGTCTFEASLGEGDPVRCQRLGIVRRAIIISLGLNWTYDVAINESRYKKLTSR